MRRYPRLTNVSDIANAATSTNAITSTSSLPRGLLPSTREWSSEVLDLTLAVRILLSQTGTLALSRPPPTPASAAPASYYKLNESTNTEPRRATKKKRNTTHKPTTKCRVRNAGPSHQKGGPKKIKTKREAHHRKPSKARAKEKPFLSMSEQQHSATLSVSWHRSESTKDVMRRGDG